MRRNTPMAAALLGLGLLFLAPALPAQAAGSGYGRSGPTSPTIQPLPRSHGSYGPSRGYVAPRTVWVPGAWVHETQRTWVPGYSERIWHPARFETRFDLCGRAFQVQVSSGHWTSVHHPGHWREHTVRVWRPGHWRSTRW
jgi:hypothetical protein